MTIPHLERNGSHLQLIVDERPYLLLGGELYNSTSSDPRHFGPVFAELAAAGVSTVIATVSWEQVETAEGSLDFTVLDEILAAARANSVRLVLIWFGAFKNAASTYAPRWVRADRRRFPRAAVRPGQRASFTYEGATPKPVLSVFSPELLAADRKAYCAMLAHLRDHDPQHTVVLIQVENETGLLGDSRDRSAGAELAWHSEVPPALVEAARSGRLPVSAETLATSTGTRSGGGTWSEVFVEDATTDEIFMAWAFASYVGDLAAAGKHIHPLPTYVNAWQGPQPGQERPGQYPSGGPTDRMRNVWRLAAPAIDFLSPDIYTDEVADVLAAYSAEDNPLFVPEAKLNAGNLFKAIGSHAAIGYCAFGIEDARADSQFLTAQRLLRAASDVVTAAQAHDHIRGVLIDGDIDDLTLRLGDLTITARHSARLLRRMLLDAGVEPPVLSEAVVNERKSGSNRFDPADRRPFGIIIATDDDELLLIGQGFSVDFTLDDGLIEIDEVVEQRLLDGRMTDGRRINGDERLEILPLDGIGAARVRLLRTSHNPSEPAAVGAAVKRSATRISTSRR